MVIASFEKFVLRIDSDLNRFVLIWHFVKERASYDMSLVLTIVQDALADQRELTCEWLFSPILLVLISYTHLRSQALIVLTNDVVADMKRTGE